MQVPKIVKTVSVIGCGWLGMPLALELNKLGFQVSGSVRTLSKTENYLGSGIKFFLLDINPETKIIPEFESEFWKSDVIILTIPPSDPANYCDGISSVLNCLEKHGRKITVIYTSSTGVYGKTKGLVDESFPPNPERAGAAAVLACEKILLEKKEFFDICILRLAGLIGPGRLAGRFFAGKKNLGSGSSPVNLVKLDDCISIIVKIIEKGNLNGIFNVCSDQHPTHREFYPEQSIKLGLEAPEYGADSPDKDLKIIDNRLLKSTLDYEYLFPDPLFV